MTTLRSPVQILQILEPADPDKLVKITDSHWRLLYWLPIPENEVNWIKGNRLIKVTHEGHYEPLSDWYEFVIMVKSDGKC